MTASGHEEARGVVTYRIGIHAERGGLPFALASTTRVTVIVGPGRETRTARRVRLGSEPDSRRRRVQPYRMRLVNWFVSK
jgi:hypothetical protein